MNRNPLAPLIERARLAAAKANEREPVVFAIEPIDAEAERALLAEIEELVAEGVLVELSAGFPLERTGGSRPREERA